MCSYTTEGKSLPRAFSDGDVGESAASESIIIKIGLLQNEEGQNRAVRNGREDGPLLESIRRLTGLTSLCLPTEDVSALCSRLNSSSGVVGSKGKETLQAENFEENTRGTNGKNIADVL